MRTVSSCRTEPGERKGCKVSRSSSQAWKKSGMKSVARHNQQVLTEQEEGSTEQTYHHAPAVSPARFHYRSPCQYTNHMHCHKAISA